MTRILGISGSLRRDSHNTRLLRAAAETAGPDVQFELYDRLKEVPPYDEDDDVHPRLASVGRLNAAIANADAVLFATPEYNASMGARVLDVELPVPHAHTRFDQGGLTDDEIRAGLADTVAALAEETRRRERAKVVA